MASRSLAAIGCVSFPHRMLSSRAFIGIGDSPVRSRIAGFPVNRWKRSAMTSAYSCRSRLKREPLSRANRSQLFVAGSWIDEWNGYAGAAAEVESGLMQGEVAHPRPEVEMIA